MVDLSGSFRSQVPDEPFWVQVGRRPSQNSVNRSYAQESTDYKLPQPRSRPASAPPGGRPRSAGGGSFGGTADLGSTLGSTLGSSGLPRPQDRIFPTLGVVAPPPPVLQQVLPEPLKGKVYERGQNSNTDASKALLVIEMQWNQRLGSPHFPAHGKGEKYKQYFSALQNVLQGKNVQVLDFSAQPGAFRSAIWDRFSKYQRFPGTMPSNQSYSSAPPSRIGAFEVHLLQSAYRAEKICPAPLEDAYAHHAGPPEKVQSGVYMCAACAAYQRGQPRPDPRSFGKPQHSLIHSKLWSRRWPNIYSLTVDIGVAIIPTCPSVPAPVTVEVIEEPKQRPQALSPPLLQMPQKLPMMSMPLETVNAKLVELDCPAQRGWFVNTGGGADVLAKCGGGSHTLYMEEVLVIFESLGVSKDTAREYLDSHKAAWNGKKVNEMLKSFCLQTAEFMEKSAEVEAKNARREAKYNQLVIEHQALTQTLKEVCLAYAKDCETAMMQKERTFVTYANYVVKAVRGAAAPAGDSIAEWAQAMRDAEFETLQRKVVWDRWLEEVSCWNDVPDVFEYRPDLNAATEEMNVLAQRSRTLAFEASQARRIINEPLPSPEARLQQLEQIQRTWAEALRSYQ